MTKRVIEQYNKDETGLVISTQSYTPSNNVNLTVVRIHGIKHRPNLTRTMLQICHVLKKRLTPS